MTIVTKQPPMQRYDVHDKHGQWAATIVLRDYERSGADGAIYQGGEIIINSDYGAFAYSWGNMGSPLKDFLCSIGRDYILNKLTNAKTEQFDFAASIARAQEVIRCMHEEGDISLEDRETAEGELPLDDEGEDQFIRHLWAMDVFKEGDPPTDCIARREIPLIANFYTNVWVPFVAHLRTELAAPQDAAALDTKTIDMFAEQAS